MPLSRRNLILGALGAAGLPALLAACSDDDPDAAPRPAGTADGVPAPNPAPATTLAATPACDDGETTPTQTEGPYFTSGSPANADLAADAGPGTRLSLSGSVLTTACSPVPRAKLDFWQADDSGEYDNRGFRLRGHVFTDDQGRYQITTVMPGLYPGRTRHIHVKAQAPAGRALTTQLYFPGEAANAGDGIYRKECEVVMEADRPGGGKQASFTFVLEA